MNDNLQRVTRHRERAKAKGYTRRDYYATPLEHSALKAELERLRRIRTLGDEL